MYKVTLPEMVFASVLPGKKELGSEMSVLCDFFQLENALFTLSFQQPPKFFRLLVFFS